MEVLKTIFNPVIFINIIFIFLFCFGFSFSKNEKIYKEYKVAIDVFMTVVLSLPSISAIVRSLCYRDDFYDDTIFIYFDSLLVFLILLYSILYYLRTNKKKNNKEEVIEEAEILEETIKEEGKIIEDIKGISDARKEQEENSLNINLDLNKETSKIRVDK